MELSQDTVTWALECIRKIMEYWERRSRSMGVMSVLPKFLRAKRKDVYQMNRVCIVYWFNLMKRKVFPPKSHDQVEDILIPDIIGGDL